MNLARNSNIIELVTEDRVRTLLDEYIFNSDSDHLSDSDVESDHLSDSDVGDDDDLVWSTPSPVEPAPGPGSVDLPGPSHSNSYALTTSSNTTISALDPRQILFHIITQPSLFL